MRGGSCGAYPLTTPGIATHLVAEQRRQEVRDHRLRSAILPDAPAACHADRVAAQVTAQALSGLLNQALAGLSPGDRDVLVLIAWEGLTYEEVARALDIPVSTVRSRLNRARRQVRAVLEVPQTTDSEGSYRHG
ncbi:RNA polymerase sigma factor [Amycolatopsis magusensis]|uniref:RNA polymerase sigma factor (Sigma-70 family) n=1 Tax=Amycolatopsis magusensis TaxID=882444 RepID=A0ABS4PW57_9PSEU|nr:RNA polymerase sigma factor [Amycolatopsis magusensis]MBP2183661.1 RNA polymerase sigma factor (sigma-70 family) [Amycolatopsis magusensis]